MGYMTALHLVDVKIKPDSLPVVTKALGSRRVRGLPQIASFLQEAFLTDDEFLLFKSTGRYESPYEPCDDDGTVSVLVGKWYESEQIANWLKQHSEKSGRLIQHSWEADGEAWGWEFDGRGRLRELKLKVVGKWH